MYWDATEEQSFEATVYHLTRLTKAFSEQLSELEPPLDRNEITQLVTTLERGTTWIRSNHVQSWYIYHRCTSVKVLFCLWVSALSQVSELVPMVGPYIVLTWIVSTVWGGGGGFPLSERQTWS